MEAGVEEGCTLQKPLRETLLVVRERAERIN